MTTRPRSILPLAAAALLAAGVGAAEAFAPSGTGAANSRWTSVASGFTGFAGTPATITWSVVPDGTLVENLTNTNEPSDLIARLDATFGGSGSADLRTRPWFRLFDDAFSRLGEVSGLTVVYEPNDDGVLHNSTPGSLGVRGDVRLGGIGLDGSRGVLAYNYFPVDGGDMAIDTDDLPTSFSNASGDFRELRNTVMHELGHGVGLDHVNSDAAGILMEPIISVGFDGPQHDDIRGLQWLYGDPLEKSGGNNTAANASPLGVLSPGGSLAVGTAGTGHVVGGNETDFVSISNERDTDFFSFSIASPVRLDATLTPRGDSYDQDGAFFNTTQTSDLALTILGPDGTTVLRQAAGQPAGVAESVAGVVLPSPGTYFARVTGPSATNSVVQLYQLDLSASAAGPALPGDFNGNGVVDAADFTLWRDSEGAFVAAFSGADHSGNGRVDAADRTIWRNGFGDTASASAVPEPATIVWLPVAAACCAARSRNDGRQPVR